MSKLRKHKARATRRCARRAAENAARRGVALKQQEQQQRPARMRHRTPIEILFARGSISRPMFDAGCRFERDFRTSGSLIGQLVASYTPRPRKIKYVDQPDEPRAIRAREAVERALNAAGPLAEVLLDVAVFDRPPSAWAMENGFKSTDGAGAVRIVLSALSSHYAGNRQPARYRLAPPPVPPSVASARPARPDQEPVVGASYGTFLQAQTQGTLVDDDTLRAAIRFAEQRGLLDGKPGSGDEMCATARQLETLVRTRWVAAA